MGLKKKDKKLSALEVQLRRLYAMLETTDPTTDKYDKILDAISKIETILGKENGRKDRLSKETIAKIIAMLAVFGLGAYGDSQGWILGKSNADRLTPKPPLWGPGKKDNK